MADREFDEPDRIKLLKTLATALGFDVIPAPTVWACLWLSDIDKLQELVRDIQTSPGSRRFFWGWVRDIETTSKLIPKCNLHS